MIEKRLAKQQKSNARKAKKILSDQGLGMRKIWAMVANELRAIVSNILHGNYNKDLEDFRLLICKKYAKKNKSVQDQVESDSNAIENFLTGAQEDRSAFEVEEFGGNNPEPYVVKSKKEMIALMRKFQKYLRISLDSKFCNKKVVRLIHFVETNSAKTLLGKDALSNKTKKRLTNWEKDLVLPNQNISSVLYKKQN